MSQHLVYLAGPIADKTYDEATAWRRKAAQALSDVAHCLDPMRGKDSLRGGDRPLGCYYRGSHPLSTPSGITTRDRWDVSRADVVLMNLLGAESITIGTMIEVGWADAYRKPIVLVMEDGNAHDHPIVRSCSGFVVPTLDEGTAIVRSLLE